MKNLWERVWAWLVGPEFCQHCLGTGVVRRIDTDGEAVLTRCPHCEGTGREVPWMSS